MNFITCGRKHQELIIIDLIEEDVKVHYDELEILEIVEVVVINHLQVNNIFFLLFRCYKYDLGRTGVPVETESSRPSPQPGKEPGETSSVTEDDNSEDDSDSREAQYRCSHCFTTSNTSISNNSVGNTNFPDSKDWQPGGKDRQLLCWDCRSHLKKTNELPPLTAPAAISGTPPIGKLMMISL